MANTVAKYQKYAEYQDSGIEWLCEIPSHWFLKKHKYIAEFSKGKNLDILTKYKINQKFLARKNPFQIF
jgi:hypothetical protein